MWYDYFLHCNDSIYAIKEIAIRLFKSSLANSSLYFEDKSARLLSSGVTIGTAETGRMVGCFILWFFKTMFSPTVSVRGSSPIWTVHEIHCLRQFAARCGTTLLTRTLLYRIKTDPRPRTVWKLRSEIHYAIVLRTTWMNPVEYRTRILLTFLMPSLRDLLWRPEYTQTCTRRCLSPCSSISVLMWEGTTI